MKTCITCKIEKPLASFYKHPQMADGFLNKCKECQKANTAAAKAARPEYYKAYDMKRANLPHRIKARKETAKRWGNDPVLRKRRIAQGKAWQERNLLKRAAHIIVGNAVKAKRLVKQPCEVCGKVKVHAHHDDYAQPLQVRWLCQKHHFEHHRLEKS